jgi:hypothetical protein
MLDKILARIHERIHRHDKPVLPGPALRGICAGCHDPLPPDAVTFNGERWCSVSCWYDVPAVLRKGVVRP